MLLLARVAQAFLAAALAAVVALIVLELLLVTQAVAVGEPVLLADAVAVAAIAKALTIKRSTDHLELGDHGASLDVLFGVFLCWYC